MTTEEGAPRKTRGKNANDSKVNFALYVLLVSALVAGGWVIMFMLGAGPQYADPRQVQTRIDAQPAECRPILRSRLARRLIDSPSPLRPNDVDVVFNNLDIDDCAIASAQLTAIVGGSEDLVR